MKIQSKSKYKTKKFISTNPFKVDWNGVPATARYALHEAYLAESVLVSISWHILMLLIISIIAFIISYFGLNKKFFPVPQTKVPDIEFSIGSHHHHSRGRGIQKSVTSVSQKPIEKKAEETPAKVLNPIQNIFSHKAGTAKAAKTSKSKTGVPEFAIPMPKLSSMGSGLGSSSGGKGKQHSNTGTSSGSPSLNDIEGAFATGKGTGSGTAGFNKTATKNIITTYDISPYVNELRRNIRWNWKPVSGSENKRVELFLRIAKDGKIVILNVKRTSESGDVDNAALNAVRKSAPLNPLPSQYKKSYLDIIFTFSNNSVGNRY